MCFIFYLRFKAIQIIRFFAYVIYGDCIFVIRYGVNFGAYRSAWGCVIGNGVGFVIFDFKRNSVFDTAEKVTEGIFGNCFCILVYRIRLTVEFYKINPINDCGDVCRCSVG